MIKVTVCALMLCMGGALSGMREDEQAFDKITVPGLKKDTVEEGTPLEMMRMHYGWTRVCTDERLISLWNNALKKDRTLGPKVSAALMVRSKASGKETKSSRRLIKEFGDLLTAEMELQNKNLYQQNTLLEKQVAFLEEYKKDSDAHTLKTDKTNRWRYWMSSVTSWVFSISALGVSVAALIK